MQLAIRIAAIALALANCAGAVAAGYPERPIRLVVPAPAGGAIDIVGRITAAGLSPGLGQNIMDEAGLKGYEASGWYGLYAPARTPAAIVRKLNETLVAALKLPETRERLNSAGLEPIGSTAEEFAAFLRPLLRRVLHS